MTSPAPTDLMVVPVATAANISQGTTIEQSRAIAEVQAMVIVAQKQPRDLQTALAQMRESCGMQVVADRAFYRYTRGGEQVSGPTIHLMRELARCFGNLTYGITELARDDEKGESEMQTHAWDLQTNTRSTHSFIVPHVRDRSAKKGGSVRLVDMRDIYESNTNAGSRRLRETIRAILPPWFVEEAVNLCTKTLQDGGGRTFAQRIADAIKLFDGINVTADQLVQKIGRPTEKWTEHDFASLRVIYKSIERKEVTVDKEFPPERVTVAEITGKSKLTEENS